jgi:hypothetical protein
VLVSYPQRLTEDVIVQPVPLSDSLKVLELEIATLFRELPRLPAEDEEGRVALIKCHAVIGIFDTFEDAYTAKYGRHTPEAFLTQPIDSRDLQRLAPSHGGLQPECLGVNTHSPAMKVFLSTSGGQGIPQRIPTIIRPRRV